MNRKKEILKIIAFIAHIAVLALYLYIIYRVVLRNEFYSYGLKLFFREGRIHELFPKVFLYIIDYFSGILLFITCLLYVKKRKKLFYMLSIIDIAFLLLSMKYNLPLYFRQTSAYVEIWKTDVIEYFYPVVYFSLLLCILFFPVMFDFIKKYKYGKQIIVWSVGIVVIATDIVMFVDNSCINPFLLIKGILLYLTYKIIVSSSEMKKEEQEKQHNIVLKLMIPIVFIVCLVALTVKVKTNCLTIPQAEQIDGYWFIGEINAFVETYENPYEDMRHYLDIEYVKEGSVPETWNYNSEWTWIYDEEEEKKYLVTYERKAEAFYYLDLFQEEEYAKSLHRYDLDQLSSIGIAYKNDSGYRSYRAVLSMESTKNTVYYYEMKSEMPYSSDSNLLGFLGGGVCLCSSHPQRAIEGYDIAIGGKEIPAYFLGMVNQFGIVKVEPYTHYHRENPLYSRKTGRGYELQTKRQY